MPWRPRKDWRPLVAAAESAGFGLVRESGGHVIYGDRGGRRITFPKTPSDHRSLKNAEAQLRRIGVCIEPNGKRSKMARGPIIENYSPAAASAGVPTTSALDVLTAIAALPGDAIFDSVSLLGKTGYHKGTNSSALRWMEEKGYADRLPERGRKGVNRYRLAEDGRALIDLLGLKPVHEPEPEPEPAAPAVDTAITQPARFAYPDPVPGPLAQSTETEALVQRIAHLEATVEALGRSLASTDIVLTVELPGVVYMAVSAGPDHISSTFEVSDKHMDALNCLIEAVKEGA